MQSFHPTHPLLEDFPHSSASEESACNAGDPGLKEGLEKEVAISRQYSHLGNPVDRGAWQAAVNGIARVGQDLATKPSLSTSGQTLGLERNVPSGRGSGSITLYHMAAGHPLLRGGAWPF